MTTIHALKHVAAAVAHAEVLADEAGDLGDTAVSNHLRLRARQLGDEVENAVAAFELIEPMKLARLRAHATLDAVHSEITVRLAALLAPEDLSRLTPGAYLDIAERARFRLRRISDMPDPALQHVKVDLRCAVLAYEDAVDHYLVSCADAQGRKDAAVIKSQALRVELEGAKARLLVKVPVDSDAWRRIKRRAVRTKRARWLNEARAQRLLADAVGPVSSNA